MPTYFFARLHFFRRQFTNPFCRRIAEETEMIGADIMQDLRQQRETLLHTRDSAKEIEENLSQSRKVMKAMFRRIAQNRRVMYGVAIAAIVLVVGVLALRFSPRGSVEEEP
mmetsp:Transcript_67665/g.180908  ORF Transcript_67665/g.180908 Transcript_67665/m.180908 type:complete len:111 (-) Transcript_67665:40-372(-)